MAVYINILNGGNITVGSGGGGSSGHAETRFTLEGGTVETHNITGTLDQQWLIDNGYFDESEYTWTKQIAQIDIGNTVTSIGEDAFVACSSLTSVTIPDSVTSIEASAFDNCSELMSVTIGNNVTSIGNNAFCSCGSLTSVTIPSSVESIGEDAFTDCSSLTSVTFLGKTLAQVQDMENYSWEIEDTSIINVA